MRAAEGSTSGHQLTRAAAVQVTIGCPSTYVHCSPMCAASQQRECDEAQEKAMNAAR